MPKSIFIDPKEVRKPQILKINDIPLNQYKPDIKKEIKKYGEEKLLKVYYDMLIIREFESMLNAIKTQGSYEGIQYDHLGPAHLSIGQESSAVGQCVNLGIEDFIFGSHRSHGEVLAKCLSAIDQLDENKLLKIMKSYMDGACLKVVEKEHKGNIKSLAQDFVLYGVLAEIFGRANGFNKGLGGSMHVFFAPFGSMPNNAIVGGAADISVGAALFKRINRKPGIVICNIGDGSMGCGPVWEAIMLAAMDQYRTLWDKDLGGAPPILFNFFNNFYGMGGQTSGETMGYKILARVGAGVNPENLHVERVDGYNPLAVADAIERKKKILLKGKGPVLLDVITYRISGHSPSDASSYRSKEEISAWQEVDCIKGYEDYLKQNRVITSSKVEFLKQEVTWKITKALKLAVSQEISPRVKSDFFETVMFSNRHKDRMEKRTPEVLISQKDNPRVRSITHKYRFALDENNKVYPKVKVFTYRDALFEAMLYRFYEDPTMVAYGEDNRDWGGAFAVYRGLTEALPYHRLFNTTISEGAIVGSAVGYALCGGRVVVELMYSDFIGRAGDELFNQVAKWQSMSAGLLTMPLIIRVSVGNKYGAQHSQEWTSLLAHIPGLKVMFPATPYDAKGMLNLALHGTDPVVFFESQRLYDIGEYFVPSGVPEDYYEVPEGEPIIRKEGKDVTLLTIGATLYKGMEAAEELEKKYKVLAEVIDLRFINPLNYELIIESVKKTGRFVLVSDACERGSFLHTIASNVSRFVFDYLDGPAVVVGSRNWITPAAEMESSFFPQKEWIIDAIHERLYLLEGHQITTDQSTTGQIRRNKLGI
ncbi:MAG TPA: dehydrogenase [Candidatus Atribacteria bacterium]|nr:dehydrogenase [Candidatus Atribacteria bacterium]